MALLSLRRYVSPRSRNLVTTISNLSFRSLAVSTPSRLYCDSPNHNNLTPPQSPNDDVTTPELKMLVERYVKGEDNVMPQIFEAVLNRSLSGNHEESDDEFLKELERNKLPELVEKLEYNSEDDELPEMFEAILERTLARHASTMPPQAMDGKLEVGNESDSEDENLQFLPSDYKDTDEELETGSEDDDSDEEFKTDEEA